MFKATICFSLLSLTFTFCLAAEYERANSATARILDYEFDNIGTGPYRFGFVSSDGTERREEGNLINPNTEDEALVVVGSYSYVGPDGVTYTVKYTADQNGFHPEGEHISVPPYVPWVKGQHDADESGHYNLKSGTQKPNLPVYLPVTSRPTYASPLPIVVNGQNPLLNQYVSSTPRPLISENIRSSFSPILSSTPRPAAFNIFNDQPNLIAYVPTRRDTESKKKVSSNTASSILDILGSNDNEDNAKPVKIEDINSL